MDKNWPLLEKVYDHIVAHPEEWCQEIWAIRVDDPEGAWWPEREVQGLVPLRCGTAYCFAGHAVMIANPDAVPEFLSVVNPSGASVAINGESHSIDELAMEELGLNPCEARDLFDATHSLEDIRELLDSWK